MDKKQLNEDALALFGGGLDNTMGAQSTLVQGQGPGYVYRVLPLTTDLQQKGNEISRERYIHPGCLVRGRGFNNRDKFYKGRVNRIVKDGDGAVVCLYIQTLKNSKLVSIVPDDDLRLIVMPSPEPITNPKIPISDNLKLA